MPTKRICATALDAVADVADGASILVQSFGPPQAWPTDLLLALRERGVMDLTVDMQLACRRTDLAPDPRRQVADPEADLHLCGPADPRRRRSPS